MQHTHINTYSDACDDDAGPHQHAGVIPLPQRICDVPVIAPSIDTSSALSPCEFATCLRALIPSTVSACLRLLLQPSLALSQSASKFELYTRALTPSLVSAGFRQSGFRPGQISLPIIGLLTRAFPRRLLLTTPPRAFNRPIRRC